jgi:plastocyanin
VTGNIRGWAALIVVGLALVACSGASGAGGPPPSAPAGGAVITASNLAFDRQQLDVPAGQPFALLFENREAAPHNVRIYDDGVDQPLFSGETFGGPGSRTYGVPAIPAGIHRFRCDVHTDMKGTVTAR